MEDRIVFTLDLTNAEYYALTGAITAEIMANEMKSEMFYDLDKVGYSTRDIENECRRQVEILKRIDEKMNYCA